MVEPAPDDPWPVRGLRLADPHAADPFVWVRLPMRADEVLVFSALLLHRSQSNHYEGHWFDQTHPDHVSASDGPGTGRETNA